MKTNKTLALFLTFTMIFSIILPSLNAEASSKRFNDVSLENPLYTLAEDGVISGYEDGTFNLNQTINRKQAAALVNRVAKLPNNTTLKASKDVKKKPTTSVDEPVETDSSKYTGTVKYVYLSDSEADKRNPFKITANSYTVIRDGVKAYDSPSTSAKVNATYNAGDEVKSSRKNFDYVKSHYASSTKPIEWIVVQELNNTGWTFSYIKRSDVVTNYVVYVSPSASDWKYDHHTGNASSLSTFELTPKTPNFDSADYVTSVVTMHDPIYEKLPAGTSITPTGTSNSSVKKPKAGTGASTTKYIKSTGTASGDGWVAPTLTMKHSDYRLFTMDFESIGMYWNPTQHMGSIFITGDGSRLDVIAVNQEETKARFLLTNVNTKESYRSKEMLKVVLPYFFKNNTEKEINQVHSDFMKYISNGKKPEVTKEYKGFKAVFMKESNEYRLDIRY